MGTHPIFESDFDCLTERGFGKGGGATRTDMFLSTWEEFTRAAEKLQAQSGDRCRTTFKYRHGDQKLVITFTDDQHRLQFLAEYSNDVKRLEKFLTSKMRSYCDVEE